MAVERVFKTYDSPRLRGYLIQQPIVPGDAAAAARPLVAQFQKDARMKGWWDPSREIGSAYGPMLRFPRRVAWDVYLIYPPGVKWTEPLPPYPYIWMSQHEVPDDAHWMEPKKLEMAIGDLLYQLRTSSR